jgi:hypothetical protein
VKTDVTDDAGNVLGSYTDTEWHQTQIVGRPAIWKGELVFDSGVLRDFNGHIISERPLEMQMLGPLDYIGAGEIKAGVAIAGVIGIGSLRGLLSAAAKAELPKFSQSTLSTLISSATTAGRGGVTPAGSALQSHAARAGSWLAPYLGRTGAANSEAAAGLINTILRNGTVSTKVHPTFGNVISVRMSNGAGIWFKESGEWIGFLERYTTR